MIRKTGTFALLLAGLLLASCGNNAGTMASAVEVSAVEVRAEAAETDDKGERMMYPGRTVPVPGPRQGSPAGKRIAGISGRRLPVRERRTGILRKTGPVRERRTGILRKTAPARKRMIRET